MVDVEGKRPPEKPAEAGEETRPNFDALLIEMDALHAVLRAVDHGEDAAEALDLTRSAFAHHDSQDEVESQLITCAMAKLLGEPLPSPKSPTKNPWERHVYESLARAWICWASDPESKVPIEEVARLRSEQQAKEEFGYHKKAGAVHLIALYFWAAALEALAQKNLKEARRFWTRSIEVGSSFGTDSNAVILWAYGASFFPEVTRGVAA